jgi:hypothetical protein
MISGRSGVLCELLLLLLRFLPVVLWGYGQGEWGIPYKGEGVLYLRKQAPLGDVCAEGMRAVFAHGARVVFCV